MSSEKQLKTLNDDTLRGLLGEDHNTARKFQMEFMIQARDCIKKLVRQLNSQEYYSLKETAHFLKTSAKSVGAEKVAEILQQLEVAGMNSSRIDCKTLLMQLQDELVAVRKEVLK